VQPKLDSQLMKEEIFGPILPIITYQDFNEVIEFVNDRPKPLALYYFGENKQNKERIKKETSSGAICFNDAVFHCINH